MCQNSGETTCCSYMRLTHWQGTSLSAAHWEVIYIEHKGCIRELQHARRLHRHTDTLILRRAIQTTEQKVEWSDMH